MKKPVQKENRQTVRTRVQTLAQLAPDLLALERDIKVANAQAVDAENYGTQRASWGPLEKRLVALVGTEDADPRILLNAISALATLVGIKINKSPLNPPRGYEATTTGKFRSKPDRRRRELQEAEEDPSQCEG